jgi:hypothetical protein
MADDQAVKIITGLLWIEIPLLLFFFANIYFANKPNGGFWIGNNKILTIFVLVFSIILITFSGVAVGLPDTDEESSQIFTIMGVIAPGIIIFVYACIYAYPLIFKKGQSGSIPAAAPAAAPAAPAATPAAAAAAPAAPAPTATKGGGRRRKSKSKSKK